MDIAILLSITIASILILIGIKLFFKKDDKANQNQNRQRAAGARDVAPRRVPVGAPRRAQLARNRARLRANVAAEEQQQQQEDDPQDEEVQATPAADLSDAKIGAKKRAKLEAKAEKKAQREVEEQLRAEKKKKEQQQDEEKRKSEELERAESKRKEEEEKRLREEKERREHEEYLKMKEAFAVEEEGFEEGDLDCERNILQEFVDYVKANKVVVIEDLALHFKLKTQAVIDRIRDLQSDNILSGVIDDRGKFIYVSPEEMEAVAKFIKQRGRVSIAELAENSNQLINLTPINAVSN